MENLKLLDMFPLSSRSQYFLLDFKNCILFGYLYFKKLLKLELVQEQNQDYNILQIYKNKMIIQKVHYDSINGQGSLTKQLHQYKKINATLKKKIKAKDRQINYLYNCIDDIGKVQLMQQSISRSKNFVESSFRKEVLTEVKRKEKQNLYRQHNPQTNIFKNVSSRQINKINKEDLRLPSLGRNSIFSQEYSRQEPSLSKQKIIRVSLEKLVPLKPQEVKKKFEMKYKSYSSQIIQE